MPSPEAKRAIDRIAEVIEIAPHAVDDPGFRDALAGVVDRAFVGHGAVAMTPQDSDVQIHVVNFYKLTPEERSRAVYIGRRNKAKGLLESPLANPFKVEPFGPYKRGEAKGLYEGWLRERLARRDLLVRAEMNA